MRSLKMLCLVMAAVLMLNIPVYADEPAVCSSSYIDAYDSALSRGVGAEFHIWFHVMGTGTMDEIGASEIRVQQSPTGTGDWTTVKIFRKADYPKMVCQNSGYHNTHVTYYGLSGNYYRAIVLLYAKDSTGEGVIIDYAEVLYLSPQW